MIYFTTRAKLIGRVRIIFYGFLVAIFMNQCQKRFIYYGEEASIGQIPWQAALFLSNSNPSTSTFCGGVILNRNWILTAAHCFEYIENDTLRKLDYRKVLVFSGSTNLKDTISSNITKIDRLYIPESYEATKRQNDIALLRLKSPLNLDMVLQKSISLPDIDEYEAFNQLGKTAVISGWGEMETGSSSDKLRMAKVPIANFQKCRENYFEVDELITSNMICAGFDEGNRSDSCGGDSGGPLFVHTGERNILLGVISWGIGCSLTGLYGVYTDCFKQRDWIESICEECVYGESEL